MLIRKIIRFTSIFEDDAKGVKLIKFRDKINIFDVGASDGIAAKFFLRNLKVRKIFCFEPDNNFVKILNNLNNNKIIVMPFAIGNQNKVINVYYPVYRFLGKKFKFATFSYYDKNTLKKQISLDFIFRKNIHIINEKLKIRKFNEFNYSVDLIKIDVNGFEFSVIKGLIKIIKKNKPALLIETGKDTNKIKNLLKKYSYKQFIYNENSKKFLIAGKKYALNTYFLQKKHIF